MRVGSLSFIAFSNCMNIIGIQVDNSDERMESSATYCFTLLPDLQYSFSCNSLNTDRKCSLNPIMLAEHMFPFSARKLMD